MERTQNVKEPKKSLKEQVRSIFTPVLLSVCTWLIMDKLSTMQKSLDLIPSINIKMALFDQHFVNTDEQYNTLIGDYNEFKKEMRDYMRQSLNSKEGTKEEFITLDKLRHHINYHI